MTKRGGQKRRKRFYKNAILQSEKEELTEPTVTYPLSATGPYFVHVEMFDSSTQFPILKKLTNKLPDMNFYMKLKTNLVLVQFSTPSAANTFIAHNTLKKKKLKAYIPLFYISRKGIISIETDISDETLLENIESEFKVLHVYRISQKTDDPKQKYVPTSSVVVTFEGEELPKTVRIFYNVLKVKRYIYPVIQCLKCFKFGHKTSKCKSLPKCGYCFHSHYSSKCTGENIQRCVNCVGQHSALSQKCNFYTRLVQIKTLMSEKRLPFRIAQLETDGMNVGKYISKVNLQIP